MLLMVIRIGGVLAARDNNTYIKKNKKKPIQFQIKKKKKKVKHDSIFLFLFLYAWLQRIILSQCGYDNGHFQCRFYCRVRVRVGLLAPQLLAELISG